MIWSDNFVRNYIEMKVKDDVKSQRLILIVRIKSVDLTWKSADLHVWLILFDFFYK